jgi:putative ABC transport system permease protein
MDVRRFFTRARLDGDTAREINSYIDIETDDNIARGMTPQQARAAALRKFGNPVRIREELYFMNTIGPLDTFWHDLRFALRLLRRDKGFAIAAILSLTLGIGANTAMFQLLDAIRLRSLPVERPHELVELRIKPPASRSGSFNGRRPNLTYAQFDEIRRQQQAFSQVFAWSNARFNTARGGEVKEVEGLFVSGEFFSALGVPAVAGRVLTPDDDRNACPAVAVISYPYWQRAHGGDPAVLTRTITLDGAPQTIIGVTPPSFFGMETGRQFDVALPLCADARMPNRNRIGRSTAWWLAVAGRLKPGLTIEQASQHLEGLSTGLFTITMPANYTADDTKTYAAFKLNAFEASTGVSQIRMMFGDPLVLLLGITGIVLAIACANLANLLLARANAREREIAVRLAIGASRIRIVRQLLIESLVLASAGALLGAVVARQLGHVLVNVLSSTFVAVSIDLTWNWRALGFTAGVAMAACMLFGLAPAWRATAVSPSASLKTGTRGTSTNRERSILRRGLVITQVALSVVLLAGALLFTRTLYNLMTVDVGFRGGLLMVATAHPDLAKPEVGIALRRQLQEQIAALPDVESVAAADYMPLMGNFWNDSMQVEGSGVDWKVSNVSRVGRGYFATAGARLLAGREFTDADRLGTTPVAIATEEFVRQLVPNGNPIGKIVHIRTGPGEPEPLFEIVGVAANAKYSALRDGADPLLYVAAGQQLAPDPFANFILRSRTGLSVTPSIARAITNINPTIDLEVTAVDQAVRDSVVRERLMAILSASFGVLAVLLAAVGLYGVMAYSVARRTNEIGIRVAMGADRARIMRMILADTLMLVGIGLALGTGIGLAVSTTARTLLFGLEPTDPITFGSAAFVLGLIGLIAGLIPARRAANLDPATAVRAE